MRAPGTAPGHAASTAVPSTVSESMGTASDVQGRAPHPNVTLRIPHEWLESIDEARGDQSRTEFIRGAVRKRLTGHGYRVPAVRRHVWNARPSPVSPRRDRNRRYHQNKKAKQRAKRDPSEPLTFTPEGVVMVGSSEAGHVTRSGEWIKTSWVTADMVANQLPEWLEGQSEPHPGYVAFLAAR